VAHDIRGRLIAGLGLPGAGKSAVFAALASVLSQEGMTPALVREPEEDQWPAAVRNRDVAGYITALTWFRSQRVPALFEAAAVRDAGGVALVDSYYDKLIHLYFDHPGFEWLMKRTDPYRAVYQQLIAIDHRNLPDADCVVDIVVSRDRWYELVRGRGRELDRTAGVLDTFDTQPAFTQAAQRYCKDRGIPYISFENVHSTALAAATALRGQLKTAGVLP